MTTEIEKMLHKENQEKKRTGAGIHSRTGKRGYVGKMLFPSDIMSRKDKYNYRKNGKVKVYKMQEVILEKSEFFSKEEHEQRELMIKWRELYQNKAIMEKMGLKGNAAFHKLIKDLEIPLKQNRVMPKNKTKKKAPTKIQEPLALTIESLPKQQSLALSEKKEEPKIDIVESGLHLKFNGEYSAQEIGKFLQKLDVILEGEENKFYVNISLVQRK